jgi:hypothetical protein
MTINGDEHIRELLVPYSLGLLSDDEARDVRVALDASSELRSELAEIEAAGATLVRGAVQMETAPAVLRARVLDSIGAADRSSASARRRADRRVRWRTLVPSAIAAGCAGACAVLAVVAISFHNDLDTANHKLDAAAEQRRSVPADLSLHTVSTTGDMKPASGQLIRIASDRYVLLLHDVPDPGVGNSWQIWTANSRGKVANVGKWVDGASTQAILVSGDDIHTVMISHEPTRRDATQPSSAAMAQVSI